MSDETYNVMAEEFVPMAMQSQIPLEQDPACFMEVQGGEYLTPGTLHPCQTENYPLFFDYEQQPQQAQNVYTFPPNSVYTPSNATQQQFFYTPPTSDLSSANSSSFGYGYGECASSPSSPSSMSAGTSATSSDSLQMPTLQMNQQDFIQHQQQIPQQQPLPNNFHSQTWNSFPLCQQHENMLLNLASALKMRQTLNNLTTLANWNGLNGMLNLMQSLNKQNNTTADFIREQTNAANNTSNDSTNSDSCKGRNNPYFQWMLLLMQHQYGMTPPSTSDLFTQNNQSESTSKTASTSSKGRGRGKNRKKQTPMALQDQVETMQDELSDLMIRLKLKKNTDSSNETFSSLLKLLESRFNKLKTERNQLKSANERHRKSQAETKKLRAELKELKASIKRKEAKLKKKQHAL